MKLGYLATRLTGLREEGLFRFYNQQYRAIAEELRTVPQFRLHAPHEMTDPIDSPDLTPQDIYLIDRLHVTHSDVVVACLELPSFGVGSELQMASDFGIPVVCYYYNNAGRMPSRLIMGMPAIYGGNIEMIRYDPTPNCISVLSKLIKEAVSSLLLATPQKKSPPDDGIASRLARRIRKTFGTTPKLPEPLLHYRPLIDQILLAGEPFHSWVTRMSQLGLVSVDPLTICEDRVLLPCLAVTQALTQLCQE